MSSRFSVFLILSFRPQQEALHTYLGYSIDEREPTLAQFVHWIADTNGDGTVGLEDFGTKRRTKYETIVTP